MFVYIPTIFMVFVVVKNVGLIQWVAISRCTWNMESDVYVCIYERFYSKVQRRKIMCNATMFYVCVY